MTSEFNNTSNPSENPRMAFRILLNLKLFWLPFIIEQLNHRVHNKLIVADNRFAIVGGRNFSLDDQL